MPLDDIVNVQITAQTQTVSQPGFGIPLIVGTNKSWTDRARSYSSLSSVALDFTPQQPEYIAAQAVFSQNPRPTGVVIGRRDCDVATLNVLTALPNTQYDVFVNGLDAQVKSQNLQQVSTITWSADFVANNLINVVVNNTVLGTITSVLTYSTDFNSNSSISTTVNGTTLTPPVTWTTDQATTIAAVATQIASAPGVASAVAGTDKITVTFTNPGANTVNSSIVSGTGSQPTCTIVQGGFLFNTNQSTTINAIATAISALATVSSAVASGDTITITSTAGTTNTVNTAQVYLGLSQPTSTIVNDSRNKTIAEALVSAINSLGVGAPVTAAYTGSPDGTFTITANVSGTAYTLKASTTVTTPNAAIVKVTDSIPNQNYYVTLKGVTFSYVAQNFDTVITIATALAAAVNAASPPIGITATDNGDGTFKVASSDGTSTFSIFVPLDVMTIIKGINILPYVPSDTITNTLNAINNLNLDWYSIVLTDRTLGTVMATAAWTETMPFIFGTASNDANIINVAPGTDTTSVAAQLQQAGYVRTFCMYHQDAATDYPEAAWMGVVLPLPPGGETWKFKQLAGVNYSNLTDNQSAFALGKNCNTYEYIGGVGITQNGTSAEGEFIDIVRGMDWLKSQIVANVYSTLVNNPKVPYTDAGIAAIQSQVQKALTLGINNNFIASDPAPKVIVPLAANVPALDKANRILKNVTFTATLAGAIHAVDITGTLTV